LDVRTIDRSALREGTDIDFLLVDEQTHAGSKTRHHHVVKRLMNSSGVQRGSKLEITFDPAFQSLTLHAIEIRRGEQVIDKLEREKIKIIQREKELERHIYDGRVSAVLILEGTRVGDIVDYDYSVTGENPVFQGHFVDSFAMTWSAAVAAFRYRLLWPAERSLGIRSFRSECKPQIVDIPGGLREYTWQVTNSVPVEYDPGMPSWYSPRQRIRLSEFKTWSDVVEWAVPLYARPGAPSPDLKRKVEEWTRSETNKASIALSALRFIQDHVRYMGVEVGENSHSPTHPDVVLERRFGDCKDKVLLLTTILGEAGVVAHPVLVSSWNRYGITNAHPSPTLFNHVIAQIALDGTNYWVDPTISHQGGNLQNTYCPNYGYGLVIREDGDALSQIPVPPRHSARSRTVENSYFFASCLHPGDLTVRTTHRGTSANSLRHDLEDTTLDDLGKQYLNFYAGKYPNAESKTLPQVSDNRLANSITVVERYEIPSPWRVSEKGGEKVCTFYPYVLLSEITEPDAPVRSSPLHLPFPVHYVHTVEIRMPELKGRSLDTFKAKVRNPAFEFTAKATHRGTLVRVTYEFVGLRDHVEQHLVDDYVNDIREVRRWLRYEVKIKETPAAKFGQAIRNVSRSLEVDKEKRRAYVEANAEKADRILVGFGIVIGAGVLLALGILFFERREGAGMGDT